VAGHKGETGPTPDLALSVSVEERGAGYRLKWTMEKTTGSTASQGAGEGVNLGLPGKYVLKVDLRMPIDPVWGRRSGAIIPRGTVFYKEAFGYRPWFHSGPDCLALADGDLIGESQEPERMSDSEFAER